MILRILRRDALRTSESRPNPELNLQGVTGTTLDRTVEVEDEVGDLGAAKVPGVEQVEDLQHGLDDELARVKHSGQAQVQRRERVVFSTQVALRDGAVGIDPILRRQRVAAIGAPGTVEVNRLRLSRTIRVSGVEVNAAG